MRSRRPILPTLFAALALATITLRADPGDVAGSRDYPDFPRIPGFILTDYDEDNPAEFDFPVSRPTPLDADHIEMIHVNGYRYVIRYEAGPSVRMPTLMQTQLYYERVAARSGYTAEKTGAVGDVSETFHKIQNGRETWVYLVPAISSNVLTIVESSEVAMPPPPRISAVTPSVLVPVPHITPPPPKPATVVLVPTAPDDTSPESLFTALNDQGRVVVPLNFLPGKDDLDGASQPVLDNIAAMMKAHPDLFLRIESHTDNLGDPDDNMRLSGQRAFAIRALLIADNIEAARLDAVGVGGLQPIADNNTAEGREKNRRIELVLRKKFPSSQTSQQ
jgi:outer membrane protein OmpA-like peptidoglycan-associated protein